MIFSYMINNFGEIIQKLIEHIQITLIAVLLAILVGVPLGIIVSRTKKVGEGILAVANIFQTIPSLALFGFIIPLPLIGGIGYRPAVVVLFLYALLPIIKNTYIGIKSVDDSIKESAKGVGMTPMQTLFMVSLPLAFPVIMGGIRVATVINIGTATIAALIGAGGLGDFIFRGISMSDNAIILAGAIPTTILALSVDFLLGLLEKNVSVSFFGHLINDKKVRRKIAIAIIVLIVMGVGITAYQNITEPKQLTIGTKNYTESRIMGQLLSVMLEENLDFETDVRELGGTLPNFEALKNRDIDMYVEYTGTGYITILKKTGDVPKPDEVYNTVKEEFDEKYGISWLKPLGFNNTYTLAVRKETAEKYNLKTFSDLVNLSSGLTLGAVSEFLERPDGYPGLQEEYGYEFQDIKALDPGLRYNAISSDQVQVIDAFSTDAKIEELNLTVLEDDKEYFPPYYAAPVVNNETLKEYPEVKDTLNKLADTLTDKKMQKINYLVDVEKRDAREVVEEFLRDEGLIK